MTSSALSRSRLDFTARRLDLDRFAWVGLLMAVAASGLLVLHFNRGSSFLADDWPWILGRRGGGVEPFLAPYNGHLSVVPIAIYRLMFAAFGIHDFTAYRILLLGVASATGIVIFTYVRRRVSSFWALLVTTLLLFLGPGWNDIIQPFQIAWLIAVGSGILALSLLERRRGLSNAAACLLILVSVSSTSVGLALAVGVAVEIAIVRRRWRDAWIVGLPLALYAAWAVHYQVSEVQLSSIPSVPFHLAETTAAAAAGIVGLSAVTPLDLTGLAMTFGVPLLALGVAVVIVRSGSGWEWSRFVALTAALLTFLLMTSLARSFQSPFESRYMYVICVLEALVAVELIRGVTVPRRAQLGLATLALAAVVSNIGILQSGGALFRAFGERTDATLTALDLDRGKVASSTALTQLPLYPLVNVTAGQYLAAARELGSPAFTLVQLQHASSSARSAADAQLLDFGQVQLRGLARVTRSEGCLNWLPPAAQVPSVTSAYELRLAPGRSMVSAGAAAATLSVRRFAPSFTALGTVQPRGSAVVSLSRDRAALPWHLRVQSIALVRICRLAP